MIEIDPNDPHALRRRRIHWRAHHRGLREADMLVGGWWDRHGASLDAAGLDWFEALLEEQDVDILAWAMRREPLPERYAGAYADSLLAADYVSLPPR